MRQTPSGDVVEVLPSTFNVRTRVHEYGGGAVAIDGERIFFVHFSDQRLYRCDINDGGIAEPPYPISPTPDSPCALRFADMSLDPSGAWLYCVLETHSERGVVTNSVARLGTSREAAQDSPLELVTGADFYSNPRVSPDGKRLAWLSWNHPNMPWDATELWVADLSHDAAIGDAYRVAGGEGESVFQPEWNPDGDLYFVSDRTGWWNLYRHCDGNVKPLCPMEAEFGAPQWVFGMSRYALLNGGRMVCSYSQGGIDRLALLEPDADQLQEFDLPYTAYHAYEVRAAGDRVVFIASSPESPAAVVEMGVSGGAARTERIDVIRRSIDLELDARFVSHGRPIEFPTTQNRTAHAIYYPPQNGDYYAPETEKPPLVVMSHGGPTGSTSLELSMKVQYWTSRGFAVVDVNYSGSTGYGRAYRERLKGAWGIVDTEDCIQAAKYLVDQGLADADRLAIRGGSAGGYTTLCALVFHDVFAAGASYFGVADLTSLAADTHKFESRYLDGLIGPYPETKEIYESRSPIRSADQLSCPVILLQGLEDKVVPPSQAEVMVKALEANRLPYAYIAFEGEQHGFRQASTVKRATEAELSFYARVFGFAPAGDIEDVELRNFPTRR